MLFLYEYSYRIFSVPSHENRGDKVYKIKLITKGFYKI